MAKVTLDTALEFVRRRAAESDKKVESVNISRRASGGYKVAINYEGDPIVTIDPPIEQKADR